VEVIVPVYNPTPEFCQTIDSLLNQTYPNFNIIIINDASLQGKKLIDAYRSYKRIKVADLQDNTGGGGARNHGLKISKGQYVAFCDSDDIWPKDKLSKQIAFMKEYGFVICHTDIVRVRGETESITVAPDEVDLREFLSGTALFCSTVCVSGDLARSHSFGEMRKRHPFKFWVSLLQRGHISHRVPSVAVKYVHRSGSVSSGRISTLAYTLLAYILYPNNKLFACFCLLIRARRAISSGSRIVGP
jgi:teichuronic acid biosynthesis glycosyltransferase TuaG